MMRKCLNCHRPFSPLDLAKEVSKDIEGDRKALGIHGMLVRCSTCSGCGHNNLFLDFRPLKGETPEEYKLRRDELEVTIKQNSQAGLEIALVEKWPDPPTLPCTLREPSR